MTSYLCKTRVLGSSAGCGSQHVPGHQARRALLSGPTARCSGQDNGRSIHSTRAVITAVDVAVDAEFKNTASTPPRRELGKLLPDGSILFTAAELQAGNVMLPTAAQVQQRLQTPVTGSTQEAQTKSTAAQAGVEAPQAPIPSTEASPVTAVKESEPAVAAPGAQVAPPTVEPVAAIPKPIPSGIDWAARRRQRVVMEIMEAAERSNRRGTVRKGFRPIQTQSSQAPRHDPKQIEAGLMQLEMLLPGFQPNLDALPAEQWAQLALDVNTVASRVVALKAAWPGIDLSVLLTNYPKALMMSPTQIAEDAVKVRELLRDARNPDAIVQSVPVMLAPQVAASVLVTMTKWFPKRQPVDVLEQDPDIVRRAQEMDQPFEPVYEDANGNWVVPGANKVKRPEWAEHIVTQQKNTKSLRERQMQQRAAAQQQYAASMAASPEPEPEQQTQASS